MSRGVRGRRKMRIGGTRRRTVAEAQPAMAKAAGSARAPVPTIRLKMNTAAVPAEKLPEVCSAISARELQGTSLCETF